MTQPILPIIIPYADLDGSPLQDGSIYFGDPNQMAEAVPITVYWDAAGTQPAAQPLKTINGNIVRAGAPANVFLSGIDYSTTVRNKQGEIVYSTMSASASGFLPQPSIITPTAAAATVNLLLNTGFTQNTNQVSGSVVLQPGQYGHDGYYAGASGCTYTFATVQNTTTITISAGTLKQTVPGPRTFSTTYSLSWVGTAPANINGGSNLLSPIQAGITGGAPITCEWSVGTVIAVQLQTGVTVTTYAPGEDVIGQPWLLLGFPPTFISGTSVSIATDLTKQLPVGSRVKIENPTGYVYATIATSSFAAGVTTITIRNSDSGVIAAGVSAIYAGLNGTINYALPDIHKVIGIPELTATVAASALTMSISNLVISFRSDALNSGIVNTIPVTSSIIVPSGATLGTIAAEDAFVVLLAMNVNGVEELAVVNRLFLFIDESALITTVALTAASDSADVIYSITARTNAPFRVLGYAVLNQAVPGTWTTAPTKISGLSSVLTQQRVLHVRDVKAQNTSGGSSSLGIQTRVLNTIVTNSIPGASLAGNNITLPSGKYQINAFSQAQQAGVHALQLYNVTDTAVVIYGQNAFVGTTTPVTTAAHVNGVFSLPSIKQLSLRHDIGNAIATNGLGIPLNTGGRQEVYTDCVITKVV